MNLKLIGIAALCSFSAIAEPELKGSPSELKSFFHPDVKTISITQSAEEIAFKDVAVISMLITTEDKKLAMSLQKNTKLRNDISATLTADGIHSDQIKNSKFSTSPDYGWFGDKPDNYKVANTVTVRIDNELGFQSIAKIVDAYDEVTLINTDYEHSEKDVYIQKTKQNALNKVLAQKDFYVQSLGIDLQAISFNDRSSYEEDDIERIEVTGSRMKQVSLSDSYQQQPVGSSFEKITYSAKVTVTFVVQ
ncbi:SIMPL domain-containing protein [Thalassotalea sp. Y01]|uniref:SIMPL domain-containing protein n=1 Tax=Thalassotalea sp. Y01 TaxID=2729613 RepID=UPI00145E2534|nr:SIMPL domain-containing protein [Thalassotalea sp. Y01]NMP17743.1 SIMPL domain-containing protein [Thalassotalea sp. Y01]